PGSCSRRCPGAACADGGPVSGRGGTLGGRRPRPCALDAALQQALVAGWRVRAAGCLVRLRLACDLLLTHRKGLSQSALPYRRSVPTWLKLTSDDVKEQIYKLAKKGLTPSQIGVILRDSHGVAQVRFVTGNKILRILKSKGLAPDLPEDLYHLIKKAVAVRKHLERNRKDKDAKFRLILIESRIHRLARYYKTKRVLPPNWKYESSTASALVA
uniref:Small ribosomal subunit protein uS15 n=3 Tax=Telluraves TaxID=3073808 RepID=A0A663M445_ATHCN